MHEGSIVKSLFEQAAQVKARENLLMVNKITIEAGEMHQLVAEVMQMYFQLMRKEYPGFEEAELEIISREVKLKCLDCGAVNKIDSPLFICPVCYSSRTEIISGNELHIQTMEGLKD